MPLWIVATPLGTLGDLSPRARDVLGAADLVCCEDTRTTRRLLSAVDMPAPRLVALHAHNEAGRAEDIARMAADGDVVLVSDAGTPAVSDPGQAVVAACLAAGVRVLSVPGPSALATALAASGFPAAPSAFLGFPPRKGRDGWAADALARPETLVIYEAPSRVVDLVGRLAGFAPHREAALCRELSKKHETIRRAPLPALAEALAVEPVRGECVLVVGPGEAVAPAAAAPVDNGASLKDIAAVLASRWGVSRRAAYQALLDAEARIADGPLRG